MKVRVFQVENSVLPTAVVAGTHFSEVAVSRMFALGPDDTVTEYEGELTIGKKVGL